MKACLSGYYPKHYLVKLPIDLAHPTHCVLIFSVVFAHHAYPVVSGEYYILYNFLKNIYTVES